MTEEQILVEEGQDQDLGVEERARMMGWIPKEEFTGDPETWVDAETFVKQAEERMPLLKATLRKLEKKLSEQSRQMAAMQKDFQAFVEMSRKAQENAYLRALAELRSELKEAVEDRDSEKFEQLQRQYEQLLVQHPAFTGKQPQQEYFSQEVFDEWESQNPWYKTEPEMREYAQFVDAKLAVEMPWLNQKERLEEITRRTRKQFPSYFSPRPRRTVESVSGEKPTSRGKSYDDLPPEAKAVCDRLCRMKRHDGSPLMTREEYVKTYFESLGSER